jgi:DNA-binding transcriptional ArsR family regulator
MAPRSAARRNTTQTVSSSPRPLVRGFGSEPAYAVEFDVRTAYDFLLSIRTKADEELLPEDRRWLDATRESNKDLVNDKFVFGPNGKGVVTELARAVAEHRFDDRADVQTAADVVRLVEELPADQLLRDMIGDLCEHYEVKPLVERAFDGDTAAIAELEATLSAAGEDLPLGEALRDPEESAHHVRAALRTWQQAYATIEPHVLRIIEADAESRRADFARLDPAEAIERTTGGLRWLPEPGIRRVVLAPTYFGRPYNWLFHGQGWRLIAYPVSDATLSSIDRSAPPQAAVRFYRALGDETRLRVLRLLVERDYYLTELAQQLDLSKPTMKHHLTQLRAAGLVTIIEEGGLTYYSLRRERVAEAGVELAHFLRV